MNETYKDLAQLVQEQGSVLDTIESHMTSVVDSSDIVSLGEKSMGAPFANFSATTEESRDEVYAAEEDIYQDIYETAAEMTASFVNEEAKETKFRQCKAESQEREQMMQECERQKDCEETQKRKMKEKVAEVEGRLHRSSYFDSAHLNVEGQVPPASEEESTETRKLDKKEGMMAGKKMNAGKATGLPG